MALGLLIIVPIVAGLVALALRELRSALNLLVAVAAGHLLATLAAWILPVSEGGTLLALDLPGHLFLSLTSLLFFGVSLHAIPYALRAEDDPRISLRLFVPCLLWFLAAMTLVTLSQDLAVMWAAIEATTLASAPLIYVHRHRGALEATWKYLLLCSVGIALALLGTFFLGIACSGNPGAVPSLLLQELLVAAPLMSKPWFQAAFIMALVGYGTKMGLAPLHTWLPDAHSQAPSPVSALLSGALLNCAFLGILRFFQIALASGDAAFARSLLLLFGFLSMAVAAAFMAGQGDYKRLLAYSSVENMGILAIGIGLGGAATFGAMLHAINHSLCKAALFLLAGNVLHRYGTTRADGVQGMLGRMPATAVLLTVAFMAIGGAPPFGPFMSELVIFQSAMAGGNTILALLFLVLLAIAFLAMAGVFFPMLQGKDPESAPPEGEARLSLVTPMVFCLAVLVLGVHLPPPLSAMLHRLAEILGGGHV